MPDDNKNRFWKGVGDLFDGVDGLEAVGEILGFILELIASLLSGF
jgi:hypothetical protein